MTPIAIVSALIEEQSSLRERLENPTEVRLASRTFLSGVLCGQHVVLALSGIGKVAAAITACTLIERFEAGRIVFTGVAGGLHPDAKVGDVVIADQLLQHDMNAAPLAPRHVVPLIGRSHFDTDAVLSDSLHASARRVLAHDPELARRLSTCSLEWNRVRLHRGCIISGDRFVSTAAESDALRTRLPEAWAVEMEGAALAQVCHDHGLPFAVMRTISDRADATAHGDFLSFVKGVASHYSERIVLDWLAAQT
jgi:adenosylhomocysteine nucleosidase